MKKRRNSPSKTNDLSRNLFSQQAYVDDNTHALNASMDAKSNEAKTTPSPSLASHASSIHSANPSSSDIDSPKTYATSLDSSPPLDSNATLASPSLDSSPSPSLSSKPLDATSPPSYANPSYLSAPPLANPTQLDSTSTANEEEQDMRIGREFLHEIHENPSDIKTLLEELIRVSYRYEKDVKDAKALYEWIIETLPQAIWVFNSDGEFFYRNTRAKAMSAMLDSLPFAPKPNKHAQPTSTTPPKSPTNTSAHTPSTFSPPSQSINPSTPSQSTKPSTPPTSFPNSSAHTAPNHATYLHHSSQQEPPPASYLHASLASINDAALTPPNEYPHQDNSVATSLSISSHEEASHALPHTALSFAADVDSAIEVEYEGQIFLVQTNSFQHRLLITATDITSQRRQARLASMGQISAHLAHEIRNPIGSISLLAATLQKNAHEAELPIIEELQKSIFRVERIIKATLLFSKGISLQKKPVRISDFEEELQRLVRSYSFSKPIEFVYQFVNVVISVDFDLMVIALQNFLFNAIDAIEEGEKERGKVIVRSEIVRGGWVCFVIHDDGKPFEDIKMLFEPFATTKLKGNGLGLALASQIIYAHSGRIIVQEQEKEFSIYVPKV